MPRKILLSDDASDFRAACQEKLREKGYEVIVRKRDGFEVLSAIQNEHPDLVVMDTQMRHIDAIALLNTIGPDEHRPLFYPYIVLCQPAHRKNAFRNARLLYHAPADRTVGTCGSDRRNLRDG